MYAEKVCVREPLERIESDCDGFESDSGAEQGPRRRNNGRFGSDFVSETPLLEPRGFGIARVKVTSGD